MNTYATHYTVTVYYKDGSKDYYDHDDLSEAQRELELFSLDDKVMSVELYRTTRIIKRVIKEGRFTVTVKYARGSRNFDYNNKEQAVKAALDFAEQAMLDEDGIIQVQLYGTNDKLLYRWTKE